jgi:predicted neutral ceramidase superfamily lipid hydrolase
MRNLLLARCFSLCIVTVRFIICCSFCNLQFLESLLWVPGRRREHYEWNTREANQVCGCVLACTCRSSLYCMGVCVYLYIAVCEDQGSDYPQSLLLVVLYFQMLSYIVHVVERCAGYVHACGMCLSLSATCLHVLCCIWNQGIIKPCSV